jgi:hypothetical protein
MDVGSMTMDRPSNCAVTKAAFPARTCSDYGHMNQLQLLVIVRICEDRRGGVKGKG